MKKIVTISSLMLCLSSGLSFAECDSVQLLPVPTVPAGSTADFMAMYTAQTDIKTYITDTSAKLDCIRSDIKHNQLVDQLHRLANSYNRELAQYRAKTGSHMAIN